MLKAIDGFARWWIDGLAGALAGLGGGASARRYVIAAEDGGHAIREAGRGGGAAVGRLVPTGTDGVLALDPPGIASRLAGATVEIEVPEAWLFRRGLDPVAASSAPYLDAFARHHVERVTPWRVADVHYGVAATPLPEDASRLAVAIGAVPRALVERFVAALARTGPARLAIVAGTGAERFAIPVVSGDGGRLARTRRTVGAVLAVLILGTVGAVVAGSWAQEIYDGEIAAVDRLIADRKDFLRGAMERTRPRAEPADGLRAQRAATAPAVLLLEHLARALPDQAHLTDLRIENGTIRITGIAADATALIPALESSPLFMAVAFFAPTTRLTTGEGDRFHIEMRVEPVRSVEARP